ncbi:MAG: hypothetical protein ACOZNI_29445 [Myxococcota bacterium]
MQQWSTRVASQDPIDGWALADARSSVEFARSLVLGIGVPPPRWILTLLRPQEEEETIVLARVASVSALVAEVVGFLDARKPSRFHLVGTLSIRAGSREELAVFGIAAGGGHAWVLKAVIDSDGMPGPVEVAEDPGAAVLGPFTRLVRWGRPPRRRRRLRG